MNRKTKVIIGIPAALAITAAASYLLINSEDDKDTQFKEGSSQLAPPAYSKSDWSIVSDRDNATVSTHTWASFNDPRVQEVNRFMATATDGAMNNLPYLIVRTDNTKASDSTSVRSVKVIDQDGKGHDLYPMWALLNKTCLELDENISTPPNSGPDDLIDLCQNLQNKYVAEASPTVTGEIKEQVFVSVEPIPSVKNVAFSVNGQMKESK